MQPTVVSVEWDFGYDSLLLNRSPGVIGVDELNPAELDLSPELADRLKALLERHERVYGHWVHQSMSGAEEETDEERRDLTGLRADTRAVAANTGEPRSDEPLVHESVECLGVGFAAGGHNAGLPSGIAGAGRQVPPATIRAVPPAPTATISQRKSPGRRAGREAPSGRGRKP
ncbi:hypothetical protein [Actinoplanes utahensis]|uniref:hypothetical protein n=1 Tax=Actinoplanes utahensis TaxID=1869 RepID=UPI00126A6C65|nr:hypothetical protein [Actinoplanes utahensis]